MIAEDPTGMFVSESKFRADPASFIPLIQSRNSAALGDLITKPAVEKAVLVRLTKKAGIYGQELGGDGEPKTLVNGEQEKAWKIDVDSVRELYENWMIPITKEVEVSTRSLS